MASTNKNMIGRISIISIISIIASIRKNSAEFLGPKIIKNCFAISIAIILGIIIII